MTGRENVRSVLEYFMNKRDRSTETREYFMDRLDRVAWRVNTVGQEM